MYFRRRNFLRRPRRKIIRRKRGGFRKKTGLKRLIKKIVNRKIETKEYVYALTGNLYEQTNYIGFQGQTFSLMPSIGQGTGNGQRIGDRINPVSCIANCYISRSQMWAQSHYVRVLVFSVKDYNADIMGSTLPSIEAQNFFRAGTGTGAFAGLLQWEGLLPVNKDRINIYYDKVKYIGNNQSAVNNTTDYKTATVHNNPFSHFRVNLTKHMKKLLYDENGTNPNLPTNHNLWIGFAVCSADGALGSGTTQVMNFASQIHLKYKDA